VKPVAVLGFLYPLHKRVATIVASRLAAGGSVTQETVTPLYSRTKMYVYQKLTVDALEGTRFLHPTVWVCDQGIPFSIGHYSVQWNPIMWSVVAAAWSAFPPKPTVVVDEATNSSAVGATQR